MLSFQCNKTGKLVTTPLPLSVSFLLSSITHFKNINNTKTNIIPPPPSSHEIDIVCTNQVMTSEYVSIGPNYSVSPLFGYPQPPTPSPNSSDSTTLTLTTSTPPTMSIHKVLEQRQKKWKRKMDTQKSKSNVANSSWLIGTRSPFNQIICWQFGGKLSIGRSLKPSSNFAWVAISILFKFSSYQTNSLSVWGT